jgi:curved DNA-binding protein CbpA
MTADLYTILGVRTDASTVDVERAYREQVRECHPDLNPANEEARKRFQHIQAAFDVLHSPERRAMYDLSLGPAPPEVAPDLVAPMTGDLFQDGKLDSLRFPRRTPGTAMIPYQRRGRLISLVEWLVDSDFLAPLILIVPFLVIHVVAAMAYVFDKVFR